MRLVATDVARGSGQRVIRVTPSGVGRKLFLSLSIIICRMQAADLIDGIEGYERAKAALLSRPAAHAVGQAHQALDRGRRAGNVLTARLDLRLDEIKTFPSARVRRPFVSCRGKSKDLTPANQCSPAPRTSSKLATSGR